jgi:ParB/RepB/Spo0J family partition protein
MEVMLKIEELKTSASNVRSKHTKKDIKMMADSITNRGIINPPTVAKNGDGRYEVIAGLLRYKGAVAAGITELRCFDVTALTESERVEISLAENIDRRQMSAIEYHIAFNKLFKAGMTVPTIASRFDKGEREVQQLLAIGSLPKKILDLAEAGDIGDRTLKALAIASGKDVVRYTKLSEKERPNDWDIQTWLAGADGMYLAKHALFDLDEVTTEYTGATMVDLFAKDDELWLLDGCLFWELQNAEINKQLAEFIKLGWECEQVDYFNEWSYDKIKKSDGGKVIYSISKKTGAVEFHKGWGRKVSAGSAPKADNKDGVVEPKPEVSKAFLGYMDEIRNAAVKRQMLDDRKSGLVGTLCLLLKRPDNINFGNGTTVPEAYRETVYSDSNNQIVESDYEEMLKELKLENVYSWDINLDALGPTLMGYPPATLSRWIITTVAKNWELSGGAKESDQIGQAIGLKEVNVWESDAAFWNGIKNKKTLLAIADECGITAHEDEPTKIIRKRLAEQRPDTWRPKWLQFTPTK